MSDRSPEEREAARREREARRGGGRFNPDEVEDAAGPPTAAWPPPA
ncbi:MAG: hypothetical protein QOJ25_2805, partial [Solirubrobacteraceae bacterium]|nr:hypothetical protein [Solirubrobacteraceae bacterium]